MNTHGRINPETLSAFLEGLPDLLESLRAEGYGLGTRQHIAAHELVGSLFARGGLPPTLPELGEWLAPLICFTPAQQEDFRERYLQWLVERGLVGKEGLPPPPLPVEVPPPPPVTPPPPLWERVARRLSAHRRTLLVTFSALVVAASLFAAYYFVKAYLNEEDPTQVVVLDPPMPDPTPVPVPLDDVEVAYLPTITQQDVGVAWDADRPAGGKTQADDLSQTVLNDPPPPAGFWVRNFNTLVALVLVPPFAALGLWQVLRRRQRRRDAESWRGERPRYDKIKVRGARERVFQSAALRPIARGLRHYLSVESRQLDARATVRASAGRGGLFTPVYGRRRTLPEYLVLIDRVGFGDQLAQFNSDIVARLSEHDVYLDTYYFHGDPRRCREGGADSPQLSLSDLAARHPDHYLIIFSDGTGLLSTTTGRPESFVEQLLYWRGRALLTPVPRLEWEYREWALEREGLKVLPASIDGLRLLVDAVSTGGRPTRAPGFDETPPYPDILREQPSLWKERDAPSPSQTRRLVTHLRRYLGPEGFELLCACAVYPLMQWSVTLFLAYELLGRHKVEEVLPRLLRLPWFRNGTMPQWLRRTLVQEMPRARRRLVRERLEHLLLAFLETPEQGLRPRFAEEQAAQELTHASFITRLSERLAAWRRSRRLSRRLEQAPARSPLAEPVFLNYITNNQHAEALPEPVRNRLFRRGVAAFGLRLAPAAALVAVAVLTGLFLLLLERPVYNAYTRGFPPDLMSRLLARPPEQTTDPDFTYTPTTVKQGQTVDVTIREVTPGEYDFGKMSIAPADPGSKITLKTLNVGRGLSYSALNQNSDSLTATVVVAPDAPPGPTELLLYDGSKLRGRLSFTVTAGSPTQTCPELRVTADSLGTTTAGEMVTVSVAGAPRGASYSWGTQGYVNKRGGDSQSILLVAIDRTVPGRNAVTVTVGGLPEGCPNSASYVFPSRGAPTPTPTLVPAFNVSVEPQTVTVCPSNPKLNEPTDSTVTVTVRTTMMVDVTVNDGKFSSRGVSRVSYPMYDWNLSGMAPGTYTVTARPAAAAAPAGASRPGVTQTVTVKGCSDSNNLGTVVIMVSPASATVYIDGEIVSASVEQSGDYGRLDLKLPLGVHDVRVSAPGYISVEKEIEVSRSPSEEIFALKPTP